MEKKNSKKKGIQRQKVGEVFICREKDGERPDKQFLLIKCQEKNKVGIVRKLANKRTGIDEEWLKNFRDRWGKKNSLVFTVIPILFVFGMFTCNI